MASQKKQTNSKYILITLGDSQKSRDIYSGHSPKFLSKLKNREEFEGGLEKKERKKKEKIDKHTLKNLYKA